MKSTGKHAHPEIKTDYESTVIKRGRHCSDGQIVQWNKTVSPETDQRILGSLICGNDGVPDSQERMGCLITGSRTIVIHVSESSPKLPLQRARPGWV